MSKVTSIHGCSVPEAGEPQPLLVEFLEELLERARSGELQGLGTVSFWRDRTTSWTHRGLAGSFSQVGAAAMLQKHLMEATE